MAIKLGPFSLSRVERAVEKVHQRLLRSTAALEAAGIDYAVAGGNAVAVWVSRVDEAAVRNTRDVDILIRREDLPRAIEALKIAGFAYRKVGGIDAFLDGPEAKLRDAVHIVFAGEKVRDHEPAANPGVDQTDRADGFNVLPLEALVRIKLTAFRDKDRTHLRDMIDVGLLDASWPARLGQPLGTRLQQLLDDPDG